MSPSTTAFLLAREKKKVNEKDVDLAVVHLNMNRKGGLLK